MTIYFAGDTHGPLDHLSTVPNDGVVIHVGDFCPLGQSLEEALPPQLRDRFFWIPGNHDYDTLPDYQSVFTAFGKDRCIDLKIITVGGMRIAGMGGIFSGKIWWPKESVEPGRVTRAQRVEDTPRIQRIDGGLGLRQRKYIYREDFDSLSSMQADVLVTHEAPSSHPHGFVGIDELAYRMGAHTIVHGHHHRDYEGQTPHGTQVIGVGLRGICNLYGHRLHSGEYDA